MLVCQIINIITIITSNSNSNSSSSSSSSRRRLIIILLVYLFIYVFICLLFSDGFSLHIREGKSILKKGKGFRHHAHCVRTNLYFGASLQLLRVENNVEKARVWGIACKRNVVEEKKKAERPSLL